MQGPDQQLAGQQIAVVQGRHQRCGQLLQDPALQRLLDYGQPVVCSSRPVVGGQGSGVQGLGPRGIGV